jgi:type IV pilus assembly protein PilY1
MTRTDASGTFNKRVNAAVLAGLVGLALTSVPAANGQQMTDYQTNPLFISEKVPPNILFLVDLSNQAIPAAYGSYPISGKAGTRTDAGGGDGYIASNVSLNADVGTDKYGLVAVNIDGNVVTNCTAPATCDVTLTDAFVSTKSYYGLFDPLRCYVQGGSGQPFRYGSVKASLTATCGTAHWDGNFLNWLSMRKKDVEYQVLLGGTARPAQSNIDGTVDTLLGEGETGEDAKSNDCYQSGAVVSNDPCWRYVKFVPAATLVGRVPSTAAPFTTPDADGLTVTPAGRFFGIGEGKIYVNTDTGVLGFGDQDFFDADSSTAQFMIGVDLTSEPNSPAAGASASSVTLDQRNCIEGDAFYAGHLACYKRDRSLGFFQKLRIDNMRVAVMFSNGSTSNQARTSNGGEVIFPFDETYNSSAITGIRNRHIRQAAPLAEATYEGLCYYHNSDGPCYSKSPANFTASVGAAGDPYFFKANNKTVPCCKSFILMISPGVPSFDTDAPDNAYLTPSPFTGTNIGLATTRLDDVAYYGRTHDLREQTNLEPSVQSVAFYAVNAMGGRAGATILASGAKYGGFEERDATPDGPDSSGQTCDPTKNAAVYGNLDSSVFTTTTSAEWDLDKDCVPDTYFDASEGGDLENQINAAIAAILRKAASGTSVSVLATSSTGEGALYQAYFFPSDVHPDTLNEVQWTGFTQGLFIDSFGNIREDTDGDGELKLDKDFIAQTRFDTADSNVKVDRFKDANGDGKADSTTPDEIVSLRDIKPLWEAGHRLALTDPADRKIITWVDKNLNGRVNAGTVGSGVVATDDGLAGSAEVIEFSETNRGTLAPYLRASTGTLAAENIINFIRGTQVSGMRDRELPVTNDSGATVTKVWKMGDPINSTPTVVGSPKERYDVIYGDATYNSFFLKYKNRRQVAYVGANDGMLHAFNAGFFVRGDGASTHGKFQTTDTGLTNTGVGPKRSPAPKLGQELWGFIPQELLPHLQWLTRTDYVHVSYVDLKPKVTDVRIFTEESACASDAFSDSCIHPGGWGTILIGGFRLGGSCATCTSITTVGGAGAPPMAVTADFGSGTNTTRTFFSSYFVLDITNPEKDPVVLWSFSDANLELTTSYPGIVRVSPTSDAKNDSSHERWFMLVGSGPTGYQGDSRTTGKVFAVDLKLGPVATGATLNSDGSIPAAKKQFVSWDIGTTPGAKSYMGDVVTLDADLDFRVDAIYVGSTICNTNAGASSLCTTGTGTPTWKGIMFRLTTKGCAADPCSTSTWGGAAAAPTYLLSVFPSAGTSKVGPVSVAAALTADDGQNIWVFWGTGHFATAADKSNVDRQQFFGVKDPVPKQGFGTGCSDTVTGCQRSNLLDVSGAVVCPGCTSQVSGVSGVDLNSDGNVSFDELQAKIEGTATTTGMDGWNVLLNVPPTVIPGVNLDASGNPQAITSAERSLSPSTVIGGTVFLTSFIPKDDLCTAAGDGLLYALFYKTGSAYKEPIIGDASGVNIKSMALGMGLPSQMAVQIGAQGDGASGATSGSGCAGRVTGYIQASDGSINKLCGKPALSSWSRYVSWLNQRD